MGEVIEMRPLWKRLIKIVQKEVVPAIGCTEPISLADVTKSTKKTVKLELPEGITVTNKDVNVTIEVSEKKKE